MWLCITYTLYINAVEYLAVWERRWVRKPNSRCYAQTIHAILRRTAATVPILKTTSTDAMSYATRPRMSRIETSAANVVANTTNIKIIAKNQRCGNVSCRYITTTDKNTTHMSVPQAVHHSPVKLVDEALPISASMPVYENTYVYIYICTYVSLYIYI